MELLVHMSYLTQVDVHQMTLQKKAVNLLSELMQEFSLFHTQKCKLHQVLFRLLARIIVILFIASRLQDFK
jgi:hypothetical protein